MLRRACYYLIPLLFLSGNYSLFIKSANSEVNENKSFSLSIDYLKKIPDFNYILGPGDKILVIVSPEYPELNQIEIVDGEGTINLSKLGRIYVKNLSVNELNNLLEQAYKKYVKYPSINVEIINYRPIKVWVEGEVANPGLVDLRGSLSTQKNDIKIDSFSDAITNQSINKNLLSNNTTNYYFPTVTDAITQSGGITPFSDLTNIKIIRKSNLSSGGGTITKVLNLEKVLYGDGRENIRIYDSDIIRISKSNVENKALFSKATIAKINPKYTDVFVFGRVNNAGNTRLSRQGVLTDALEIAGIKVVRGPVKFIRFNYDGTIDKREFRFKRNAKRGSYKNPLLKDGDLIVVGNSFLSNTNEVVTEFTAPFLGIFSTYSVIEAISN